MTSRAHRLYSRNRDTAAALAATGNITAAAHLLREACGMPLPDALDEALTVLLGDDAPMPGELPVSVEFERFSARRVTQ